MNISTPIWRTALYLGLAACTWAAPASAQNYPSKPIKFVSNFPAGGPADFLARSVGEYITSQTKQPVVVDNKPGAGGNIGADFVAKSPADGYTVLFGIDTTFTVNPYIYKNMAFKPTDLRPIMVMVSSGLLVGAHPSTGFKTLKDLIAQGKGKGLNFSSAGSGSPGHLASEIFMDASNIKIQHVPYKGNTPAVTAVLAGEVDAGVLATPGMLPHVKTGKITALAVTSRQRSRSAPDIPTVAEVGLKDLELEVLYIAMVPAATPEPVVQMLQKAFTEALKRPDTQTQLAGMDLFYEGLIGANAVKRLSDQSLRYGRVVKSTGMKVD
ncbi:tripartite tricarboxylate transporter substrate binding protein [Limnohabitans sp. T6-20]|uniref:Bug family tripartite tricarboxylate transporter substrate binding protein n=1 Tax=Limnohabitans sp. T6-20 TaxID=1100725 RepID=UPI000D33196B|nr:tripartite tricarboxylate transporter substrate binding protein [Limnohabitans sp. T6-20]PUE13042.1 TctC [Limnohabitans sp. T6-20]